MTDQEHAIQTITAILVAAVGKESTIETRELARDITAAGLRGWEKISNESLVKAAYSGERDNIQGYGA